MQNKPIFLLLIYLFYLFCGIFIGQFLVLVTLYPVLGNEAMNLSNILANPNLYPNSQNIILYFQGFTSTVSLIIPSLFFIKKYYLKVNYNLESNSLKIFFYSLVLIFSLFPLNAYLMEWNQNIVFPDSLKIIENWLIHKENQLKVLTEFMTTYDNIWSLLTGVIVIAIIPAIGEELVFRGIFQNIFKSFFKNYHVSIWLTAFIFSAIHLQFYGFFPRMLLGAVFGYVFYWTGNILIPIFMHFCNNAGTLIILHFNHQKIITLDTESTEDIPLTILFTTLIISLCTTYLIYKSKNQI